MAENLYCAWVSNESGASDNVLHSRGTSKSNAREQARAQYGRGWTAHIMEIYVDGDGESTMGEAEIETFKIR